MSDQQRRRGVTELLAAADLRLAGLAIATWLSALGCLHLTARTGAAVAGAAALLAILAAVVRLRRPYQGGWVAVAVLIGVVCGAGATAARVTVRDAPVLADLADRRATVTAEVLIRDDPRQVARATGRPTYLVPADLRWIHDRADERRLVTSARVLVMGGHASWSAHLPGQVLRIDGRLAPARGGDLRAAVLSTSDPPTPLGEVSWAQRAAGSLREGLQRACSELPVAPGGLLPGLVVGDTSRLDPGVEENFRTVGLTHLCAVSGANVAIVIGFVLLLARGVRTPRWLTAVLCGLALVGFVILARPSPSVVRAGAMGAIALIALAVGRPRAAVPALATAVTALVVYDPELAGDAGFALSTLATAGLLLLAPPWIRALRRKGLRAGLAEALAIPAAAQVACAPVVAGLSGSISLVSVPANLLAVPAVAPATVLGVVATVASAMWPPGAAFLAWLAHWPAWWLVLVARYGAEVPAGSVPWPAGVGGGLLLGALAVLALVVLRRRVARRLAAVVVVAVVVGAVPVRMVTASWPPPGWAFAACAVGQGDMIVLPVAAGSAVVVDVGPDPAAADRCLRRLRVSEVRLLLLSHFHVDHTGGLAGVLRDRRVEAVVTPDWPEPAAGREQVGRTAAATPLSPIPLGWTYAAGAVRLAVLGPPHPITGTRSDPNNNSLIVRADVGGLGVLLAGDAETEEQQAMLDRYGAGPLRAYLLKVAHHGSSYQAPAFLDAVDPAVAIVPVGTDNDYGHPNPAVLARLARGGARVLRTDVDGDVAVVRHGTGWAVVASRTTTRPAG